MAKAGCNGAGMQNNPQGMFRPSFCAFGVPSRNIGGPGEGNKAANPAEVPVKDGSDAALCAFLLFIRERGKSIFRHYFLCVQLYYSAIWGLVLML